MTHVASIESIWFASKLILQISMLAMNESQHQYFLTNMQINHDTLIVLDKHELQFRLKVHNIATIQTQLTKAFGLRQIVITMPSYSDMTFFNFGFHSNLPTVCAKLCCIQLSCSERLGLSYMNAVALGALENNSGNSTSQKGKPWNKRNSAFARDPSSNDHIHARKKPLDFTRKL